MKLSWSATLVLTAAALIIHHLPLISSGVVGVNYGLNGDNLPPPADVINMYGQCGINIVRIFEPNHDVLNALKGKPNQLWLGTRNEDIQNFATNPIAAQAWVNTHVVPYNDVNIAYITVGNEVVPGDIGPFVANAIKNVMQALVTAGLTARNIKVTTVVAMMAIGVSYPPSAGAFADAAIGPMKDIAQVLSSSGAPIMVNAYPYFAYASNPQQISLDYALFNAATPVIDGTLNYYSLFDAMVDSFYSALEKIGAPNVKISISETGWPSKGNEPFTSVQNALTYNKYFANRVVNGVGTPKRPNVSFDGVLFEMFNEDLKPAGIEQNFGFFNPNKQPVYPFWSC